VKPVGARHAALLERAKYVVAEGGLMSRGPQKIRKSDIENALKAALAAGIQVSSYEIDTGNGKIVVVGVGGDRPSGAAGMSSKDDLDRELAEFEARNGQD
jgi:hypothetical protein